MSDFIIIPSTDMMQVLGEPNAQVVVIEGCYAKGKEMLLALYRAATNAHYMGRTWDSLDEVLVDCDWVKKDKVNIVHVGLPELNEEEMTIYNKILRSAIDVHAAGPGSASPLPQRKITFKVYFVADFETVMEAMQKHIAFWSKTAS